MFWSHYRVHINKLLNSHHWQTIIFCKFKIPKYNVIVRELVSRHSDKIAYVTVYVL